MTAPDVAQVAAQQGAVPAFVPAAALAADLQAESAAWAQVIRDQKISAQ